MADATRTLNVRVTGDTTSLGRSLSKATKDSQHFGQTMHHHLVGGLREVGKAAAYAGGIIGVSFVGALGDGVRIAAQNQVAITKLRKSVDNSGLSWKRLGGHLQEAQDRMAGLSGFTNTEMETSLAQLITTTGKAASAQKIQIEAMDLARARSMPLANATTILSKAWNGNVTSLTRLGILLPKSTKHYDAYMAATKHATAAGKAAAKAADLVSNRQAALAALQKKFGGSYKAYADTASGALARIKASAEILLERLGKVLLPYLQRFAAWFTQHLPEIQRIGERVFGDLGQAIKDVVKIGKSLLTFYESNSTLVQALTTFVGLLVVGLEGYVLWTKAVVLWNKLWAAGNAIVAATMLGIPVVALVVGIAALGAAIVVLWRKSGTFRDIVKGAWADIQRATSVLVGFVKAHWQGLLAFLTGGWSIAVIFIINHWGTIKNIADRVVGFIVRRWGNVKQAFGLFRGWVNTFIINPIKMIIRWAEKAISILSALSLPGSGSGGGRTRGGRGGASPTNSSQMYAQSQLSHYGWSGSQMSPLVSLWNQESGWNNMAYNASSGATGIPQALPYSKMPRAAWLPSQGGQASASAQIGWGLGYIKGRYGSPGGAWAHEQAYNWYDKGGVVPGPRGVHRPVMAAGGETILPTHKNGGYGPTIIVNMPPGLVVGSKQEVARVVRESVITALRTSGPNAFVPTVGARIS